MMDILIGILTFCASAALGGVLIYVVAWIVSDITGK